MLNEACGGGLLDGLKRAGARKLCTLPALLIVCASFAERLLMRGAEEEGDPPEAVVRRNPVSALCSFTVVHAV